MGWIGDTNAYIIVLDGQNVICAAPQHQAICASVRPNADVARPPAARVHADLETVRGRADLEIALGVCHVPSSTGDVEFAARARRPDANVATVLDEVNRVHLCGV
jgi:hypothetical protein